MNFLLLQLNFYLHWGSDTYHTAPKIAIDSSRIMATFSEIPDVIEAAVSVGLFQNIQYFIRITAGVFISTLLNILCTSTVKLCYAKSHNLPFMYCHVPRTVYWITEIPTVISSDLNPVYFSLGQAL